MMCEACERGDHDQCGMQTWCECDCGGPEDAGLLFVDPDETCHCGLGPEDHKHGGAAEHNFIPKRRPV